MKHVHLGKTGLRVSRICLGTMTYGSPTWRDWVLDEEASRPFFQKALDSGINFFDTADVYSLGASEEVTGRALKDFATRDKVVIATKVFSPMGGGPNERGLSRKHIFDSIDASLRRLQTDYVDLYQIHRWDSSTPIAETLEALNDLVRMGKVRYIGGSSMYAWQFAKALYTSELHGWARFVSMQNHYNLVYREEEREMIPLCIDQGVGVIPWSPLARGFLAGNRTQDKSGETARARSDDSGLTVLVMLHGDPTESVGSDTTSPFITAVADTRGVDPADLSVATEATAQFRLSGRELSVAKVYDMSTGETFGVALDEGGRVVNEADFLEAEVQARSEKYGKLAPALYDLLAVSEEHAVLQVNVRVAFWPEPLDTSSIDRSDEGQAVVILSERQESKMLEILDSEAPLVAYLESQGVKVLHRDQLVPLVIAEATSSQIAEIAKRDDVAWIDQVYTHAPALNVSRNTVHAQYVNSAGYTGTGKKVAVVEAGGIRTDNSYLQGPITNRLSTCIGLEGNHQTQVAGVVSSDHSTYKGVAYNASLLGAASCDESYSDQSLMPPTIWSVIQGASVINNSWGRDSAGVATAMTRYQDDLVYTWRTSVVDSAGNIGTIPGSCPSTSPKVVSPGIAYNAITVGSFSDAGTWSSPSGWNDDSVASDSCYLDPVSTHSDRYKPEVGAPGVNITTTNGSGASTATVSGTSFAAPHVSAAVALLINRQSVLASQPEAVKAILMASAIHRPISGDASESNALYGEILGAGGIDLERADHIAYALTWSTATLFTNSFDWEGCRNYLLQRLRPRESEGRFDVDSTN